MFRLTRLELHNFCQYADFSADINCGLTAVIGPNGAGKTCMLRGIAYALTGIVDGNWGRQGDLQKDGTADPGYAAIEFESQDARYRLVRFSTSDVKFPDSLEIRSGGKSAETVVRRQAVNAYMHRLLGISCQLMFQICWGRQGQLDTLLTAPPSFINSFLQSVFDTKPLEVIRDKLKLSIAGIASLPDMSGRLSEAEAELKELKTIDNTDKLQALEKALKECNEDLVKLGNPPEGSLSFTRFRRGAEERAGVIEVLKAKLRSSVRTEEPELPMTREALNAEIARLNQVALLSRSEAEKQELLISAKERETHKALTQLKQLQESAGKMLGTLSVPDSCCRLCGGAIADAAAYGEKLTRLLTGGKDVEQFKEATASSEKALNELVDANVKEIQQAKERKKKALLDIVKAKKDYSALSSVNDAIALHEQWEQQEETYARIQSELDSREADLLAWNRQSYCQDDFIEQRARLQTTKLQLERDISGLRMQDSERAGRIGQLEKAVELFSENEACRTRNNDVRSTLAELREVFSQQRAQAIFLKLRIRALNAYIKQYMRHTQMPFNLYLNEETHIFEYAMIPDGYVHPAGHLSGAQKSISSVVLQMAVLSVVNPGMNLFLIDEPAEALDDVNKVVLAQLFERMSGLLPTIKGEMMIVTRDTQLIDSCSSVLDVSSASRGGAVHD